MPPIVSPDGKMAAVVTRSVPENRSNVGLQDALDFPQPRIHLVDLTRGELAETLIAPHGFTSSACFSPDGRWLATDRQGKIDLWDLSKPAN